MSTFWTPDGERPINNSADQGAQAPQADPAMSEPGGPMGDLSPEEEAEAKAQMEKLREQLSQVPAYVVVANHGFGLFELAAIHLSSQPPNLDEARLAIDGLSALITSLEGRLGDTEAQLREGLNQLQMGFVQISQMVAGTAPDSNGNVTTSDAAGSESSADADADS